MSVLYFGYGAHRSKSWLNGVFGYDPEGGHGAYLDNYALYYQTLSQIPDPAHSIVKKVWGDSFRAYTIKQLPKHKVAGAIWKLTEKEMENLCKWEYVGSWHELINVSVTTYEGQTLSVVTEKAIMKLRVIFIVDGLYYLNNLNAPPILAHADEYKLKDIARARETLEKLTQLKTEEKR